MNKKSKLSLNADFWNEDKSQKVSILYSLKSVLFNFVIYESLV